MGGSTRPAIRRCIHASYFPSTLFNVHHSSMSSVSGPSESSSSSAPPLNPGSDLSKLLSSLGLSAAQEQDAGSEPQGQGGSESAGFSPDPLLVSRSRLMRMKADCEHTAALLRRLVDQHAQRDSEPIRLAVRTVPSLTDSDIKVPPYVLEASSPSDLERTIDQAKAASTTTNAAYRLCASPEDLIAFVRTALTELITRFEALRKELLMAAQNRIKETMKQGGGSDEVSDEANAVANGQATQTVVDEEGQVLNEDGLPFEDPSGEEMAATTSQALLEGDAPRKVNMTSEERKRWIDDVFNRFEGQDEDDEDNELSGAGKEAAAVAPQSSKLDVANDDGRKRDEEDLAMREEPKSSMKPLKSVLKPSAASPSRQNFGHQGIRRGFLNMNPSSPAAEASSTPVSPADASDTESSGQQMTRSVSNIQGGGASAREDQATVERMTRSLDELVPAGSQPKKAKKSVRIQSPDRARSDRDAKQVPPVVPKSHAEHPDDVGVDDEAARIVDLLGPGVVAGTERGEEALRSLEKEQKEAEEAALQQVKGIKQKREKQNQQPEVDARPALGTSVMERPRKATAKQDKGAGSSLNTQATQAKASAFKRGFLSKPPNDKPREILNRPTASSKAMATQAQNVSARQSLGMSALERSLISDRPLEAQREEQGLPPTVPHARPSKAYREKLDRKKQAGESSASSQVAAEGSAQGPPKVVGTGKDEQGSNSKVRFQLDPSDAGNDQAEAEEEEEEEDDTELDLDEHDEEAYARAAYASGDKDDDEDDAAMGQDDDEGNASDWSLDSYEYSASDLADLEPTFNGLVSDLESAELAREYALAKARQMEARRTMTDERRAELERAMTGEKQRREEGDIWTESDIDGADIVSAVQNGSGEGEASQGKKSSADPPNRMSRFRASRIVQALGMGADAEVANRTSHPEAGWVGGADEADRRADEAGHDLAHMLEGAQNVGPQNGGDPQGSSKGRSPVMILPSMTPVRYPRNEGKRAPLESDRLPQEGVDLEGETDEDEADDVLMDVMRTRLEEKQEREEAASAAAAGETSSRSSGKIAGDNASAAPSGRQGTPMSNTWEGEADSRARNSGQSLSSPPYLKSSRHSPAPASSAPQHTTAATTEPPPVDEAPSAAPPSVAPGQKMSRFKAARLAAQQQ
ncbi:unnamed protein product [Jaminaea pallidilutea]